MHIPSYQIHNILKDFTRQLQKWRRSDAATANPENLRPGTTGSPGGLRLTAVVDKVVDNIMKRIASLEQDAAVRETAKASRWSKAPNASIKPAPATLDYHEWDPKKGKVKKRLVVKDSRQLVQHFHSLTTAEGEDRGR